MAPVLVEIGPPPLQEDAVQVIGDLDEVIEVVMCNCSNSDDNPY